MGRCMTEDAIQHDPSPIRAAERRQALVDAPRQHGASLLTTDELLRTAGLGSAQQATRAEKFQKDRL